MSNPRLAVVAGLLLSAAVVAAREEPLDVRTPEEKVVAPFHVANMNRVGAAALAGTPGLNSSFINAFDRRLDTQYQAREPGAAQILVAFSRPQVLRSIRLLPGERAGSWSLHAGESLKALEAGEGLREIVPTQTIREAVGSFGWVEAKLPAEPARALRLTLTPADPQSRAALRECNLLGEQTLEAINLKARSPYLELDEATPVEVIGYFSGGETREIRPGRLTWKVTPAAAARVVGSNRILAKRRGPIQVTAQFGTLITPTQPFEGVEGD
jgi:hypothetical protein